MDFLPSSVSSSWSLIFLEFSGGMYLSYSLLFLGHYLIDFICRFAEGFSTVLLLASILMIFCQVSPGDVMSLAEFFVLLLKLTIKSFLNDDK